MIRNKHILVTVLNWGLGHATRSIPIIRSLVAEGNTITLGSDGAALFLLKDEFPELSTLQLPGYNVTYPSSNMVWNITSQLPKIYSAIKAERRVVANWVKNNTVDVIISDNRYGCYYPSTENIFISHQINLLVPLAGLVNRLHAKMINRYNQIWIIDTEERNLSGSLTDTRWISSDIKIKYLGPQSRLIKTPFQKKYDISAILSGPEPQRTFLEKELSEKLSAINLKSVLVQGSKSAMALASRENLEVISFADEELLSQIICRSELIICRSGYSTIMDLHRLGGRVLFIPTPGQTEQIYLAQRLEKQGIAQYQNQDKINIQKAWANRNTLNGFQ